MSDTSQRPRAWTSLAPFGLLYVALCLGVFAQVSDSLGRSFRGADDRGWLEDTARRNTLRTIFDPTLITPNEGPSTYYIPMQSALYSVFVGTWGEEGGAHGIRRLLLLGHCFNGLLLILLGRVLLRRAPSRGPPWRGRLALLVAAGLFLLHPANIATVRWIGAGVSHVVAATLLMGSALAWLAWWEGTGSRRARGAALALAVVAAVTAGLIKETAATLAGLLPLLALGSQRGVQGVSGLRRLVLGAAPFGALAVFIAGMQRLKMPTGHLANHWGGVSVSGRAPLRLVDLLTQWVHHGEQADELKVWLALAIVAVAVAALLCVRRHPVFAGLVAATLVLLLPFSIFNFSDVSRLDRYLYLGSLPASLGLGYLVAVAGLPRPRPAALVFVLSMAAGLLFTRPFSAYVAAPVGAEWHVLTGHIVSAAAPDATIAFDPPWLANAAGVRGRLSDRAPVGPEGLDEVPPERDIWLYTRRARLPRAVRERPVVAEREMGLGGRLVLASARPREWPDWASLKSVEGAESVRKRAGGRRRLGLFVELEPEVLVKLRVPAMALGEQLQLGGAIVQGKGGEGKVRLGVFDGERRLGRTRLHRNGKWRDAVFETPSLDGQVRDLTLRLRAPPGPKRKVLIQLRSGKAAD